MRHRTQHTLMCIVDSIVAFVVTGGVVALLFTTTHQALADTVVTSLACALLVSVGIAVTEKFRSLTRNCPNPIATAISTICTRSTKEITSDSVSAQNTSFATKAAETIAPEIATAEKSAEISTPQLQCTHIWQLVLMGSCLVSAAVFAVIAGGTSETLTTDTTSLTPAIAGTLILACCATGCYEEGLFRLLIPRTLKHGFTANGLDATAATKAALLLSTVFFALLHVDITHVFSSPLIATTALFTFLQAALFGLAMSGLTGQPKGIIKAMLVHASYDIAIVMYSLLLPNLSYAALLQDQTELYALVAASIILVPAAILGWKHIS